MDITSVPTLLVWLAVVVGLGYAAFKGYIWWKTKGKAELASAMKVQPAGVQTPSDPLSAVKP